MDRLAQLEKDMMNKVDYRDFDNQMAKIREMLGNMEADDKKPKVQANVPSHGVNHA
jgi:hypothetical protein